MKNNTDLFYQKAALALIDKLNALALAMNANHTPYAASDFEDEAAALDLSAQDVDIPANPSVAWKLCFLLVQKIRDARSNQEHLRQAVNDALLLQSHLKDVLDGDELSALTGLLAEDAPNLSAAAEAAPAAEVAETCDLSAEAEAAPAAEVAETCDLSAEAEAASAAEVAEAVEVVEAGEAESAEVAETCDLSAGTEAAPAAEVAEAVEVVEAGEAESAEVAAPFGGAAPAEQDDLDVDLSDDELSQMAEGVLEAHVTLPQKDAEVLAPVDELTPIAAPSEVAIASDKDIAAIAGLPADDEVPAEEVAALADLVLSDDDMARAEAMASGLNADDAAPAAAEEECLPELDLGDLTFDEADMAPASEIEAPIAAPAEESLPPDVLVETEEVMASGFESFAEDDADLPAEPAAPASDELDPGILELMSETDPMMDLDLPLPETEAPQA